ncbi:MAG: DUF1307 domain-containing protein [Johnsonella sp.]|nr:DUF1307 domain-containing protein [Johnsonella sp.]
MKKLFGIIMIAAMFVLAACGGGSSKEKTYVDDVGTVVKVTYKGDTLLHVLTTATSTLADYGYSSKEEAEEDLKDSIVDLSEEGVEYNVEVKDEEIIMTINMDVAKMIEANPEEVKEALEIDPENPSFKKFEEALLKEGYKEKK